MDVRTPPKAHRAITTAIARAMRILGARLMPNMPNRPAKERQRIAHRARSPHDMYNSIHTETGRQAAKRSYLRRIDVSMDRVILLPRLCNFAR